MRSVSRRFPDYGWAWPSDGLDQLLKAALLPEDYGLEHARDWLARHDIETAGFREHRLLATISHRFGKKLADHPAYPRLVGLQKMLWSRSRLAMREAEPVLKGLVEDGCPIMLIKGAARIALDARLQKGRISHDIDVLVQPSHMGRAFHLIRRLGWEPARGSSTDALAERVHWLRSLNVQRGEFGDVDLHQFAYHPIHASKDDDLGLWSRAVHANFSGVSVLVPASSDRIAMAIAHGALDAHNHSDWLVDCDATIREGEVEWDDLLQTAEMRSIAVPTAVALTYLRQEIATPIPDRVLASLEDLARQAGAWTRISTLLQAKPRGSYGKMVWLVRGLAKQQRLRQRRDAPLGNPPAMMIWRGRRKRGNCDSTGAALLCKVPSPPPGEPGPPRKLTLMLDCNLPPVRRRVDFELRAGERLLAQLRYRNHLARYGDVRLEFNGEVPLDEADELILEARPSRYLRTRSSSDDRARYGAVPVRVAAAKWR